MARCDQSSAGTRAQFWFLYALFFVTLAATILYWSFQRWFLGLVVIISMLILWMPLNAHEKLPIFYVVNYLPFFTLGVFCHNAAPWCQRHAAGLTLFTGILFGFGHAAFHFGWYDLASHQIQSRELRLGISLISIAFVVVLSMAMSGLGRVLFAKLGQASLAIYLMHIVAGSGARIFLQRGFGVDDLTTHLIAGTAAGLLLPVGALFVINRCELQFLLQSPAWLSIERRMAIFSPNADQTSGVA